MKALLMAAAILAPALALANDPANAPTTRVTDMTSTQVLGKLRAVHETSIEMGNIAQSNSQSAAVRALGAKLVKEHGTLDAKVTDYAMKNNIVLSSGEMKDDVVALTPAQATTYDRDRGPATERSDRDSSTGSTRSQMGYRGATEAGTTDRMAADAPVANEKLAQRQASMDQLRALNGVAFDREFLSRVVDKGTRWIGVLQESKGKFDKTVDGQITGAIDQLKKEVSEAQQLQATLRAS